MKAIQNRLYITIPLFLVAILQNTVHEGLHYLTARMFGERVLEFRLLTNGWLTSQVIYATPMDERSGFYWLVIAWLPTIVTTLIGFTVYAARKRLLTPWPLANLGIWYIGVLFMTIDPLYFGVISWLMQRSDVNAAEIMGWPAWPFQILSLLILGLGIKLVISWRKEVQAQLYLYR
jgi:hypothetical protein